MVFFLEKAKECYKLHVCFCIIKLCGNTFVFVKKVFTYVRTSVDHVNSNLRLIDFDAGIGAVFGKRGEDSTIIGTDFTGVTSARSENPFCAIFWADFKGDEPISKTPGRI